MNFTTPVGRLVMGDLYRGQDKDADGNALVYKKGADMGKPRFNYFFAIAIPKSTEKHWAETEWGAKIWKTGHDGFPNGQANAPTFAWKITDGDSAIPNRRGKKPCDREGYKGNWVLSFSSSYACRIYDKDASGGWVQITESNRVKLGSFVQVNGDVASNGSDQQPGVYLNHSMVAFIAYGEEIVVGPDVDDAGFGGGTLPAGASATPMASAVPLPTAPSTAPPPPAPIVVAPNPAILNVPQMTALAAGASYQSFIDAGWTHLQLVQNGYVVA